MTETGSRWRFISGCLFKGMPEADKPPPAMLLASALVLLSGGFFRLYQLYGQILVDDEWHAVHKIIAFGYRGIFTDFGMADHCIPLSLFYEFLLNNLWISELTLRLPSILAGMMALIVVPLLLARAIGARAALVTCCLLSVSPLHVFYSRLARPYAISMLLSFIAVMAFYYWWEGKGRAWIGIYVGAAVLSVWFLLPAAPFVGAPFVFALLHGISRREAAPVFRKLLLPGMVSGLALMALLLPPFLSTPGSLLEKAGRESVTLSSLSGSLELFAGTRHLWLVVLLVLLAGAGFAVLLGKNRVFALYSLLLVALQMAGFIAAGPLGSSWSILLNRYTIAVLPFLLVWISVALAAGWRWRKREVISRYSFVPMVMILLFFGPFREIYFYPNHLTNYAAYQISYRYEILREMTRPDSMSPFYERLAENEPGRLTVLEAPWQYHDNIYGYYQWFHRQHMLIGFVGDPGLPVLPGEVPAGDRRFRFRNSVHVSETDTIEERGVDLVIFHRDLRRERNSELPFYDADISPWLRLYGEKYGEPEYSDQYLTVFRVSRESPER